MQQTLVHALEGWEAAAAAAAAAIVVLFIGPWNTYVSLSMFHTSLTPATTSGYSLLLGCDIHSSRCRILVRRRIFFKRFI